MKISIEKLLSKMETELQQARTSQQEESVRERIYSIKILCELILDESQAVAVAPIQTATSSHPAAPQPFVQQAATFQPSAVLSQPKKLTVDDDNANGDSLFDF